MSGEQMSFDGFAPSEVERIEARRILEHGLPTCLGVGPAKATTAKALAQRLFTSERAVTLAVYDARRAGVPICSGQEGFYLPRNQNDCIVCARGMKRRADEIIRSADALLYGWFAGWRPPADQKGDDSRCRTES